MAKNKTEVPEIDHGGLRDREVACVASHFLDSGAHSLYNRAIMDRGYTLAQTQDPRMIKEIYAYYRTDEFWKYVDDYAAFVKKYKIGIDHYANVDVIYNPEMSWQVLKYLEDEHGLHPVPVLHWNASLDWFKKHLDAGYQYIGIGGLGQGVTKAAYGEWADRVFEFLCPPPSRVPCVKTHGFAMTSYDLIWRYPWWSVDSASWTKVGAYGGVMMPAKSSQIKDGAQRWAFEKRPWVLTFSEDSPQAKQDAKHFKTLKVGEKEQVLNWLAYIGIPLGKTDKNGDIVEYGVSNRHSERKAANLLFFEEMRKALDEQKGPWPWAFIPRRRESYGMVWKPRSRLF